MTVDFMSVKTVSSWSLKAEKEAARKTQQEKTQALEQVREYLKYFTFLIFPVVKFHTSMNPSTDPVTRY